MANSENISEIDLNIKKIENKISRLEGQLETLILEKKIVESGYKIGDVFEVQLSNMEWCPVEITGFFIYSFDHPDFGAKYKYLTKEGDYKSRTRSFYFCHMDGNYPSVRRVPPS